MKKQLLSLSLAVLVCAAFTLQADAASKFTNSLKKTSQSISKSTTNAVKSSVNAVKESTDNAIKNTVNETLKDRRNAIKAQKKSAVGAIDSKIKDKEAQVKSVKKNTSLTATQKQLKIDALNIQIENLKTQRQTVSDAYDKRLNALTK